MSDVFEIEIPKLIKMPGMKVEEKDGKREMVQVEIDFTYGAFADQFVFNNPKWAEEEWAGAYERVADVFDEVKAGDKVRLQDTDKAKIGESISASVRIWTDSQSQMDPKVRKKLFKYAQAVSTAKKVKEEPPTASDA